MHKSKVSINVQLLQVIVDNVIDRKDLTIFFIQMKECLQLIEIGCAREINGFESKLKPLRDRQKVIACHIFVSLVYSYTHLRIIDAEIELQGLLLEPHLSLNPLCDIF